MKKDILSYENKKEIFYNLINSVIVFFISLLSILAATEFDWTWRGFAVAIVTGLLTAGIKFKDFWDGQKEEFQQRILTFI